MLLKICIQIYFVMFALLSRKINKQKVYDNN